MEPQETTAVAQPETTKKTIKILSAHELYKKVFKRTKWMIRDLFQSGTMNMLSAAPNNYKSWLTLDIAMSVSTGNPLFGYFPVDEPSIVWIINEEDIEPDIKERMEIINKEWREEFIYFSVQNQIKLNNETIDLIISMATERGVGFIIFDSLRSLHDLNENDSTEMQMVMDQIKRITNRGITVLFTHHNRKKNLFSKSGNNEDSRGSTAINAAVHSHITCEPKKEDEQEYLIINQPKLKGAKKLEPFRLLINLNNDGIPFIYEGEFKGSSSHSKVVEKIMQLLKDQEGKGISIKSFITADIIGERTLRKVIGEMKTMGSIVSKTWGEVQREELPRVSDGMAFNEKFFFLPAPNPPEF